MLDPVRGEGVVQDAREVRVVEQGVGIDAPDPKGGPIPQTMAAYALQGTPSLLLFDRQLPG